MKVEGKFTIDCNRCGKSYDYAPEDVTFNLQNGEYVWEKKFNCVKCGNPISIRYGVTFDPDGNLEDKNVQVDGAVVVGDAFEFSNKNCD